MIKFTAPCAQCLRSTFQAICFLKRSNSNSDFMMKGNKGEEREDITQHSIFVLQKWICLHVITSLHKLLYKEREDSISVLKGTNKSEIVKILDHQKMTLHCQIMMKSIPTLFHITDTIDCEVEERERGREKLYSIHRFIVQKWTRKKLENSTKVGFLTVYVYSIWDHNQMMLYIFLKKLWERDMLEEP